MKNNLLAIAFLTLLTGGALTAQPTLLPNVFPAVGDVVTQTDADTEGVEPGPAGANMVWDFTGITPLPVETPVQSTVVPAANTPHANLFPEANLAVEAATDNGNFYLYLKVEGDKVSTLGSAAAGVFFEFSDPQINIQAPLEYHGAFNDAYSSTVTIPGTGTFHNRSIKAVEYDAYGTLKMPDATYNNAIRLKTVEISIDSVDFDGGYSITVLNNTTYEWYVPNRPGPQVSVTYSGGNSKTVTPGFPPFEQEIPVTKSINYVTALTTGVEETPEQQLGLDLLNFGPNPAVDNLTLRFDGEKLAEELQLSVFDTQGRLLQSQLIRTAEGNNQLTLSVSDLPSGQYFLSLSNGKAVKTLPWVKA